MPAEMSELELVWPAELFTQEARVLLAAGCSAEDDLGFLLAEAFHRDRGFLLLRQVADAERASSSWNPWSDPINGLKEAPPLTAARDLVGELAERATQLPVYRPRRYYSARLNPLPEPVLTLAQVKAAFAEVIDEWARGGYFDDAFGSTCCDSDDDPGGEGERQLAAATGNSIPMWPLKRHGEPTGPEEQWSEEQFFDVVEALHDLVARPRRRFWHEYCKEWDYADFARASGQAVYRWRVNELLNRSQVPLRLAETGSDAGLLVHAAGDGRDDLVERVLEAPTDVNRDEVGHAVQLFRGRGATREAKRSAIVVLAGVLERRRSLLKQELLSKDEAALFEVANQYDLRHRGASQRADYNPIFLDWVFWWYLATVDLSDRLLARQAAP